MATTSRYRAAAIRGQNATGILDEGPTPFQGVGDFSYGAEFAKLGHGLIARVRAGAVRKQLEQRAALADEYTRAQIENLRSQAAARGQLTPAEAETKRYHDETLGIMRTREERLGTPTVKPTSDYQNKVLGLARESLGLRTRAQDFREKHGPGSPSWTAAEAQIRDINDEEKRTERQAAGQALQASVALRPFALDTNNPEARAKVLAALGLTEDTASVEAVDAALGDWQKKRVNVIMDPVYRANAARRAKFAAVTSAASGADEGASAEDSFFEQFKSILEAPDEQQPPE